MNLNFYDILLFKKNFCTFKPDYWIFDCMFIMLHFLVTLSNWKFNVEIILAIVTDDYIVALLHIDVAFFILILFQVYQYC